MSPSQRNSTLRVVSHPYATRRGWLVCASHVVLHKGEILVLIRLTVCSVQPFLAFAVMGGPQGALGNGKECLPLHHFHRIAYLEHASFFRITLSFQKRGGP